MGKCEVDSGARCGSGLQPGPHGLRRLKSSSRIEADFMKRVAADGRKPGLPGRGAGRRRSWPIGAPALG